MTNGSKGDAAEMFVRAGGENTAGDHRKTCVCTEMLKVNSKKRNEFNRGFTPFLVLFKCPPVTIPNKDKPPQTVVPDLLHMGQVFFVK